MTKVPRFSPCRAFTLTELLVVIAIGGILLSLGIAALISVARSTNVTTAGNQVLDLFGRARQMAMTENSRVEVRFYKLPDSGSSTTAFRAMRAVVIRPDGGIRELGGLRTLPSGVIVSDLAAQNTIFQATTEEKEDLPNHPNTPYRGFCFLPNGQTDLDLRPGAKWFLTLYDGQAAAREADHLPSNYAVVRLDAFTGSARVLRP